MEHLVGKFKILMGENRTMTADEIIEELNTQEVKRQVPLMIYLCIIAIAGLFGNGLVCHIYRSKYNMSSSRWFIFFLAVVDIIICAVFIPMEIATSFFQYTFKSDILCKVTVFFNLWSLLSLGFTLLTVSVDRYRKVCKPLGWQINFDKSRLLCAVAMLLGFIIALPVFEVYEIYTFKIGDFNASASECSFRRSVEQSNFAFVYVLFGMAMFTGALIVICVLYCFIGKNIKQHIKKENIKGRFSLTASMARKNWIRRDENNVSVIGAKSVKFATSPVQSPKCLKFTNISSSTDDREFSDNVRSDSASNDADDISTNNLSDEDTADFEVPVYPIRSRKAEKTKSRRMRRARARKATFSMFLISIAFVLSYFPFLCLLMARSLDARFDESLSDAGRAFYKFFLRSYFLNCAINPFIYGISDSRFRQSVKDFICPLYEAITSFFQRPASEK